MLEVVTLHDVTTSAALLTVWLHVILFMQSTVEAVGQISVIFTVDILEFDAKLLSMSMSTSLRGRSRAQGAQK